MMAVAWQMLLRGSTAVHFSELSGWVKSHFKLDNTESVDHFLHDIRTCSFLTRDDAGHYFFVHRSFMEYFVALRLVEASSGGTAVPDLIESLPRNLVSQNSIAFAIDMISDDLSAAQPLLLRLSTLAGGILPFLGALKKLPDESRSRVLAYVREGASFAEKFRAPLVQRGPNGFVLGQKHAGSVRNARNRKRQRAPECCVFCGVAHGPTNLLLRTHGEAICERCTEAAELTVLTTEVSTQGRCTFCKRGPALFASWNNTAFICQSCLDSCVDAAVTRRNRL
jgi:hypothetical protein